jgi:hypothetical protein
LGLIAVIMALPLLASLVAGGTRAVRRGRSVWWGMFAGLSIGVGGMIGLVLMFYLVMVLPHDLHRWQDARADAAIRQWLLPLDRMPSGQLGPTLAQLQANVPRYSYAPARLADALASAMSRKQIPAPAEDIAALRGFIASRPRNEFDAVSTTRLEGLASWMQWQYAIDDAVRACNAESHCAARYARFLISACETRFAECTRGVRIESLSQLLVLLEDGASTRFDASPISALHVLRGKLVLAGLRPGEIRSQVAMLSEPPPDVHAYRSSDRLAASLIPPLQRMPGSLTQDDLAALDKFVADMRAGKGGSPSDFCLRSPDGCVTPSVLYALRGAIAWAYAGPDVATALTACGDGGRVGCAMGYAEVLIAHCASHASNCRATANAADVQRLIDAIGPPQNSYKQKIVAGLRQIRPYRSP